MKPANLLIIVAALALSGCCNDDQDHFARCERNGLKIGSHEFAMCEGALFMRDVRISEEREKRGLK